MKVEIAHLPANHNRDRIMYTKKKRCPKEKVKKGARKTLLVALLTGRS
jgi:hypothetical protein